MPLSAEQLMQLYEQWGRIEFYDFCAKIIMDANHGQKSKDFRHLVSLIKQKFRDAGYEIEEMLEPIDPNNPEKKRKHINGFIMIESAGSKTFEAKITFKKIGNQEVFLSSLPSKNLELTAPMDVLEEGDEESEQPQQTEVPQVSAETNRRHRRFRFGLC